MEEAKKQKKVPALISLVVILATIVAVVYLVMPGFDPHTLQRKEMEAASGLRTIMAEEYIWRKASMSGTGKEDYWTYDVSCMARLNNRAGYMDSYFPAIAQADAAAAKDDVFGKDVMAPFGVLAPKNGYLFRAMLKDEKGELYNRNKFYGTEIACANDWKFGFTAYPTQYGKSGIRTLIMNETGTVYAKDTKGEPVLDWPAEKPETKGWQKVE